MKACSKCKRELPKSAFNRNPASRSGLTSQCGDCRRDNYRLKKLGLGNGPKVAVRFETLGYVICRSCGELRMHSEFYLRGDNLRMPCKNCHRMYTLRNADAIRERQAVYRQKHYAAHKALRSEAYSIAPVAFRAHELRRRFGISLEQYQHMLDAQGGVCAICASPESTINKKTGLRRALSVDHDHSCCPDVGKSCGRCIRALLCSRCNSGLGYFRDDPHLVIQAAIYLETHSTTNETETAA